MKRVNKEAEKCRVFNKYMEEKYPHILHKYKYAEEFFPGESFSEKTGEDGNTNAFRRHLQEYIKSFETETLVPGKPYQVVLNKDGKFVVIDKNTGKEETSLSETEQIIYHYLCFIHTARFWQDFERMRDLNANLKPLVIKDFVERVDDTVNIDQYLKKANELSREVIVII